MASNPLKELNKLRQSVWHDYIRRGEIASGELQRLIDEDGLTGVTSNPSIFEKAISGSTDYDESIKKYIEKGLGAAAIYEQMAVEDIRSAADLFRPVYDKAGGRDGFVSIEVSPLLAHDTQGTIEECRRLHKSVNRPNVMVKIPGTKEGLPAIEQMLAEGININITLLFAVERYVEVANAFVAALETRARQDKPINRIASVASFFVSRIDTLVDQFLEERLKTARGAEERTKIESLMGKIAVANAKVAYQEFKKVFSSARFKKLEEKGARVQRVLWASTSTKNPKYNDVMYVEDLIGLDTVNTMPTSTMIAFRDHGRPRLTVEEGVDQSLMEMKQLAEAGIDMAAVTQRLEDEGCEAFARDYKKLIAGIEEKRKKLVEARLDRSTTAVGKLQDAVDATLTKLDEQKIPRRIWDHDPSVWKSEPEHQKIIKNALGWLRISAEMHEHCSALRAFVDEARKAGYKHAVVLGMGGSSLCPDVCRATFGTAPGYLDLHVLDSTVPANISHIEKGIDPPRTLFIVSSKSGGTSETLSFFRYFYERVREEKGEKAGENFVAITDPGTSLEKLANSKGFRRIFHGKPSIGGRYSALSNFGMVPAALTGIDVATLLERAEQMAQACGCSVPAKDNPGVSLGVIMAESAKAGRDKVTFAISPGISTFADWVEQLIAESTGKEGRGLVPVAGETLGEPSNYSADRLFISMQLASEQDEETARKLKALESAGHPVVRIELGDKLDLGQEFFRWEMATATAGALLGIDAFDQPNVQESKDNTSRLLGEFKSKGKLPVTIPVFEADGLAFFCDSDTTTRLKEAAKTGKAANSLEGLLAAFLGQVKRGDYAALLGYLERNTEIENRLHAIRLRLRDLLRVATTVGYGPRFLHSTGQLHKGGPNTGIFFQLTADDAQDLAIPGEPYTFSTLKQAQALGDLQSLEGKERRVIRVQLPKDTRTGLERFEKAVQATLAKLQAKAA